VLAFVEGGLEDVSITRANPLPACRAAGHRASRIAATAHAAPSRPRRAPGIALRTAAGLGGQTTYRLFPDKRGIKL
jgi:hypothetical protein